MHVLQKRAVEKECQLVVVPADLAEYRLSPSDPADPLRPSVPQSQGDRGTVALGIPGEVQQMNASLAVQLSHCWLKKHSLLWQERKKGAAEEDETGVLRVLPQEFADGLAVCRWPGRYQKLCTRLGERQSEKECCGRAQEGDPIHFFLDGAHTKESINLAIEWYYKSSSASPSSQSSSLPLTATRGFASSSSFLVNRILLFNCTGKHICDLFLSQFVNL